MRRACGCDAARRQDGSVAVWLLLIAPVLFAFAGLVLDGGRVLTLRQKAANIAEQAARAALDALDVPAFRASGGRVDVVDPVRARQAACAYVHAAHPGAACAVSISGGRVTVRVRVTTTTAVLAIVGINSLTATGEGTARAAIGISAEE